MKAIPKKVFLVVMVIAAWRIGFAMARGPWAGTLSPSSSQAAAQRANESPR
jgi:hypothetical protein